MICTIKIQEAQSEKRNLFLHSYPNYSKNIHEKIIMTFQIYFWNFFTTNKQSFGKEIAFCIKSASLKDLLIPILEPSSCSHKGFYDQRKKDYGAISRLNSFLELLREIFCRKVFKMCLSRLEKQLSRRLFKVFWWYNVKPTSSEIVLLYPKPIISEKNHLESLGI